MAVFIKKCKIETETAVMLHASPDVTLSLYSFKMWMVSSNVKTAECSQVNNQPDALIKNEPLLAT